MLQFTAVRLSVAVRQTVVSATVPDHSRARAALCGVRTLSVGIAVALLSLHAAGRVVGPPPAVAAAAAAPAEARSMDSFEKEMALRSAIAAMPCAPCGVPLAEGARVAPATNALFEAARKLDESTFAALLKSTPQPGRLIVGKQTLLSVLLHPAPAPVTTDRRQGMGNCDRSEARCAAAAAAHRASVPKRTRMLALALQSGADANAFALYDHPPLHIAMLYGTPDIVALLLKAGARPDQYDNISRQDAISYALDHTQLIANSRMPALVSARERTTMLTLLLQAGAKRPYAWIDANLKQQKVVVAPSRPMADGMLWPALVEMTEGSVILDAMAALGTQPLPPTGDENLIARAALAGNTAAVAWLQRRLPRLYQATHYGQAEQHDAWSEGVGWALQTSATGERLPIFKLLARADTAWGAAKSQPFEKHYLESLALQPAATSFGGSLLSRTVATGDAALIDHAISLGAVSKTTGLKSDKGAGNLASDALVETLLLQRSDLVRKLLAAGASPVLATSRQVNALTIAIDPDRAGISPYDHKELSPDERKFFDAAVDMMLQGLTPAQVRAIDTPELSPYRYAIGHGRNTNSALVAKLVAAGFSLGNVGTDVLPTAVRTGNVDLAVGMLAAGVGAEATPAKDTGLRDALIESADLGQAPVLDRLLALPGVRRMTASDKAGVLAVLAGRASVDGLKRLEAKGWKLDSAVVQAAVDSMEPETIEHTLKITGLQMTALCASAGRGNTDMPLLDALSNADDTRWQRLMALGIARLPACRSEGDATPMITLTRALLSDPFSLAGHRRTLVPTRLRQLREAGMKAPDSGSATARELASALEANSGMKDVRASLGLAGLPVASKPATPVALNRPAALVGNYRLQGAHEVAASLVLHANGRFMWSISYGAVDQAAQGGWQLSDGKVVFASDLQAPINWFKVTSTTQYPDTPAASGPTQPVSIKLDMGKSRLLDSAWLAVASGPRSLELLRLEPGATGSVPTVGGTHTVAIWFQEMQTRHAFELVLPNLPRLKSVTLTMQALNKAPSTPFNETMPSDAAGLHWNGRVFKKSR